MLWEMELVWVPLKYFDVTQRRQISSEQIWNVSYKQLSETEVRLEQNKTQIMLSKPLSAVSFSNMQN